MTRYSFWSLALLFVVAGARAQPVGVTVSMKGDVVVVDVEAQVHASRDSAWSTLTDYEHMADFQTSLKSSKVLTRNGSLLEVEQVAEIRRGFVHFSFSSTRAVELIPEHEIRSLLIGGDFRSYQFVTRVDQDTHGNVTIAHHGEYVPKGWVPPIVGLALIESETRKQYEQFVAEILRRDAIRQPATAR